MKAQAVFDSYFTAHALTDSLFTLYEVENRRLRGAGRRLAVDPARRCGRRSPTPTCRSIVVVYFALQRDAVQAMRHRARWRGSRPTCSAGGLLGARRLLEDADGLPDRGARHARHARQPARCASPSWPARPRFDAVVYVLLHRCSASRRHRSPAPSPRPSPSTSSGRPSRARSSPYVLDIFFSERRAPAPRTSPSAAASRAAASAGESSRGVGFWVSGVGIVAARHCPEPKTQNLGTQDRHPSSQRVPYEIRRRYHRT